MRIKDLPKRLKKLALKRSDNYVDECCDLSSAFFWCDTPEGDKFWSKIDRGNIPEKYLNHKKKNRIKKIIINIKYE